MDPRPEACSFNMLNVQKQLAETETHTVVEIITSSAVL